MDFKALIHNSESSYPRSMLHCILQQTKPSCINAKGNPHSPGRTVCSDNGISYQLYWTGMRISLALFLRRPLPQILIFTKSLPRQVGAQIVPLEVDIDMGGWPD
jgi:hypothetical protein